MSAPSINGVDISSGRVTFRLYGAWEAEFTVTTTNPDEVTGKASIELGTTTLSGTSSIGDVDEGGLVSLRVTGGGGGLSKALRPQAYQGATRRQVVEGALAEGGEMLSSKSDSSVLDSIRTHWVSVAGTVGDLLSAVADSAKATWRILPDGSMWLGVDTWTDADIGTAVLETEAPSNSKLVYALEDLSILPGVAIDGKRVTTVVYLIDDSSMRAEVTFGTERGEMEELLGTFIQRETLRFDYHGNFLAKAIAQNGDGTLELLPVDSDRWPKMSKVPFRGGIPGLTDWQLAPETEVVFGFAEGSPEQPIVTAVGANQVPLKLVVEAVELVLGNKNATNHPMLAELWAVVFNAHVHTSAAPGSPTTAPTVPATAAMVQSNTVKMAS